MIEFEELENQTAFLFSLQKKTFLHRILIPLSKLFKTSTSLMKLRFYEMFINFMKLIAINITSNNGLEFIINEKFLYKSTLLNYLYYFEIITKKDDHFIINSKYSEVFKDLKKIDLKKLNKNTLRCTNKSSAKIISDYFQILHLIKYYRNKENTFKISSKLKKLVDNKKLDYEIRLCETLYYLIDLKIPEKIPSPFNDDYYTESGKSAFNNFTHVKFSNIIKKLNKDHKINSALDIGCGYGNYIDLVNKNTDKSKIYGIELQDEVFKITSKKFTDLKNIKIINEDIFNYKEDLTYDLILLNYVLFYFSKDQKQKLFQKIKKVLSEKGSVIVCQYYSQIEDIKAELAGKQNEYSHSKAIGMYYGNKILYANALWNDTSDAFVSAESWDYLINILNNNELKIHSVTNADDYYFSLFIRIVHNTY